MNYLTCCREESHLECIEKYDFHLNLIRPTTNILLHNLRTISNLRVENECKDNFKDKKLIETTEFISWQKKLPELRRQQWLADLIFFESEEKIQEGLDLSFDELTEIFSTLMLFPQIFGDIFVRINQETFPFLFFF